MQRIILITIFISCLAMVAKGQADPHFSQYQHTPLWINPAKAGQIDGDMRLIANYRNQWSSVTNPFSTVAISYDTRIPKYFGKSCSYFGAGLYLLNDQAGDANFRTSMAELALTYHQSLSKRGKPTYMSIGLMVGGGQKAFDPNSLYFDNQFNGDIFDTGLASGEDFSRTSLFYLDISAGLNFAIAIGKKSGISIGLGMYHLNRPNVSFMDDADERLYARTTFNIEGSFALGRDKKLFLQPTIVFMRQARHSEFVGGLIVKYMPGDKFAISGGALFRSSDAIAPMFRLDFKPVALAFSYDVNTSNLSRASNYNGSMEVSLIFSPEIFGSKRDCGAIFCPF
jgi:type IX secretion system PorP/SprF family membrane protein